MKNTSKLFCVGMMSIFTGCAAQTPASPSVSDIVEQPATASLSARSITKELLNQKSREALEILQGIPVRPWCIKNGIAKGRQIALAGLSTATESIEIVLFGLCFENPKNLEVLTYGYGVEWLEGRGITRYSFRVINRTGKELLILLGKHYMPETKRAEYYAPFSNKLVRQDIVESGAQILFSEIREAQRELCDSGIRSRAFPQKKLCEVFPDDLIFNIAIIEQVDDEEFSSKCPDPKMLSAENRIFENCAEYSVFKVLVHYARNGNGAFRHVASEMAARGAMQFTQRTYNETALEDYPKIKLNPSFREGAAELRNSIKAAIALLDRELSRMPEGAQRAFQTDSRLAGIYPIAAYNGGLQRAMCLYHGDQRTRKCRASRRGWRETTGYIAKYQGIWYIIDVLKERIEK